MPLDSQKLRELHMEFSQFLFRILICTLCAMTIYLQQEYRPTKHMEGPVNRIAIRADVLEHVSLGFKLPLADLIWLRLIQDFDFHDSGHVSKGWTYHMLDAITTLDRRYRIAYIAGATVLSILVHDVEGARLIYDRGVKNFPEDWSLIFRAGYHYLYEVKDCPRAAFLLNEASRVGAPQWVSDLAARLYTKSGQLKLARTVLTDSIVRFKGTEFEPQLEERLKELDDTEALSVLSGRKESEVFENCKTVPPTTN